MFWRGSLCNFTLESNNFDRDSLNGSPPAGVFLSICISSSSKLCLHGAHSGYSTWLSCCLEWANNDFSPLWLWSSTHINITLHTAEWRSRRMHLESHPERPYPLTGLVAAGSQWLASWRAPWINTLSLCESWPWARRSHLTLGLVLTFNSRFS